MPLTVQFYAPIVLDNSNQYSYGVRDDVVHYTWRKLHWEGSYIIIASHTL